MLTLFRIKFSDHDLLELADKLKAKLHPGSTDEIFRHKWVQATLALESRHCEYTPEGQAAMLNADPEINYTTYRERDKLLLGLGKEGLFLLRTAGGELGITAARRHGILAHATLFAREPTNWKSPDLVPKRAWDLAVNVQSGTADVETYTSSIPNVDGTDVVHHCETEGEDKPLLTETDVIRLLATLKNDEKISLSWTDTKKDGGGGVVANPSIGAALTSILCQVSNRFYWLVYTRKY